MSFGFGVGDFIAVLDKAKLYRERFADAPDHFDSLSREIASLTSILEYIGRVEDQLTEDEKEALAAPIKESTKLLGELEKIFKDNTSLEQHEGTRMLANLKPRAVWRRLRMKPEDVQKLRQRITMNVHFLSAIKGFRDSEAIHTTKEVVTSMRDEQTIRQEREILEWLITIDYAPQQRDHLSRRYAGTNQWLLDSDEYKSWVSGKSQTLLCPGMPGAGKTVMASVVVDDLFHRHQHDAQVGIAYVYCNFKDQERQNHHNLLSSITKQLAQCSSPIPNSLKAFYDTHQRRKTYRTLEDTINVLQDVASSYQRIFIVVDALDECEPKSRWAFLSEVFLLQKRHPTSILATAREIPDIIESDHFKSVKVLRIMADDGDVSRYISSRIPDMKNLVQGRPEVQRELQIGILDRINGMFLLAKLLIDSLSCKTTLKAIRKALASISAEGDTYAYFYEESLERIRVQPPAYVQLANQVLSWIVFAKRPLELIELQHALAVEEDEPEIEEESIPSAEIMISACAGLVTFDRHWGIIRLVHQTTQEFFNSRKHKLFLNTDSEITNTCVRYLAMGTASQSLRKELDKSEFPFYDYAFKFWGYHAGNCDTIPSNVVQLLRNRAMVQDQAAYLRISSNGAHLAAWYGLLQIFKHHLLSVDDVRFVDDEEQLILSLAACRGHRDLIEHILGDDTLQLKRRHRRRKIDCFHLALSQAIICGQSQMVRRLIQFASNENLGFESANGPSLLNLCIERGDVSTISLLLERSRLEPPENQKPMSMKDLNIEKRHDIHGTPLAFAASSGFDEMVKLLLDHGANIEALDGDGRSPLLRAARRGEASTVKILLRYGAKVLGQPGGPLALWSALENNYDLLVKLLIRDRASVDPQNGRSMTALAMIMSYETSIKTRNSTGRVHQSYTVKARRKSMSEMLLERKANAQSMILPGNTRLLVATTYDSSMALEIINNHKEMIEVRDCNGRTPLSIVAGFRDSSALRALLQHGAVVDAVDEKHRTPLWHAAAKGAIFNVMVLKENGADINCRDIHDLTPTLHAAGEGLWSRLEELSKLGGDLEACDRLGRTAILIAAGADSNSILSTNEIENESNYGYDDFCDYFASCSVDDALVNIISEHRHLIEARDAHGRTPLWWAITSGRIGLLKMFSELVDEVEVLDQLGRPPLMSASTYEYSCSEITQILLEHISQFGSENERLKPQEHITERALHYVRFFLEFNGINPNVVSTSR